MAATVTNNLLTFRPLKIGGGGWMTGHDQHSDGTLVCRTDVYGCYRWTGTAWTQLVTTSSMPAGDVHPDYQEGCYEIAIAPSNSSIFYMHYQGFVYRSADQGATWTKKTAITGDRYDGANLGEQRHYANKMAIHPTDPDTVYVGTLDNGLWKTTDGGANWTQCTDVLEATGAGGGSEPGIYAILFKPGTPAEIWAFSYGNGYFRSTDSGATWSKPASGPSVLTGACFTSTGILYACTNDGTGTIYRFTGGAWGTQATGYTQQAIPACDPDNADRVIVFGPGGFAVETTNGGTNWGTVCFSQSRAATDVPWLGYAYENYMSAGNITFDKTTTNKLLFSEGIGFWHTTLTTGFTTIPWTSMSAGIENLVAEKVYQPVGSRRIYCNVLDRGLFVIGNPDVYPHTHVGRQDDTAINHGYDTACYYGNPRRLVTICILGAYISEDNGVTWNLLPGKPAFSGLPADEWPARTKIVMCSPDNWIVLGGQAKGIWRTDDSGATWTQCTFPGAPNDNIFSGNGGERVFKLCADPATDNVAYLYGTNTGMYYTSDAGVNWSLRYSGDLLGTVEYHTKLRATPGMAGHLWITGGHLSTGNPPTDYASPGGNFYRSTDGGTTWERVGVLNDILEVIDFGFGATASGASYPTLWIVGFVNNTYGIYYTTSANLLSATVSGTWFKAGDYAQGFLDKIETIEGDKTNAARCFVGYVGSGFAYGSSATYSSEPLALTLTTN
jgi:photosystem II stability/assembly factor-like uncharacterized protein